MIPRHELTEALSRADSASRLGLGDMSYDEVLDWLMPAVHRIARARASRELRVAAGECDRAEPGIADWLRVRANDLDWQEEPQRVDYAGTQCTSTNSADGARCILTAGHPNAHVSAAMDQWVQ